MHGKQLFHARVLEKLASELQSLDYSVGPCLFIHRLLCSEDLTASLKIYLRPTGRLAKCRCQHNTCVFICSLVARPYLQSASMGLARQPLHSSRAPRQLSTSRTSGALYLSSIYLILTLISDLIFFSYVSSSLLRRSGTDMLPLWAQS